MQSHTSVRGWEEVRESMGVLLLMCRPSATYEKKTHNESHCFVCQLKFSKKKIRRKKNAVSIKFLLILKVSTQYHFLHTHKLISFSSPMVNIIQMGRTLLYYTGNGHFMRIFSEILYIVFQNFNWKKTAANIIVVLSLLFWASGSYLYNSVTWV